MGQIKMDTKATVNERYEFLQIIKDFDDARQIFREAFQNSRDQQATTIICKVYTQKSFGGEDLIIDIIDNGVGLEKDKVHHFFNLADSSKIDENFNKINSEQDGYKGHGSKIFLNSEKVIIASKSIMEDGLTWAIQCDHPVRQLREDKELRYSNILNLSDVHLSFPKECNDSGFFLRIINPLYFKTKTTWYTLNHLSLRDYIKWFTVFGSIKPFIKSKNSYSKYDTKLYLRGLGFGEFRLEYGGKTNIEPKLEFVDLDTEKY